MAEWFYSQDGQRHGPITRDRLRELAQSGELRAGDLIWKNGMPEWVPASTAKGLIPSMAEATNYGDDQGVAERPRTHRAAPVEDYDDYDNTPPPKTKRKKGMSAGLLWGLIGGGVALVAVVVLVILLMSGGGSSGAKGGGQSFSLQPDQSAEFQTRFEKGLVTEVSTKTTGRASLNVEVVSPENRSVAKIFVIGDRHTAMFIPRESGEYRIKVTNKPLLPREKQTAKGTISWQTHAINNNTAGVHSPPFAVAAELTDGDKEYNGKYYKGYSFSFVANRTYVAELFSRYDNYLYIKDSQGRIRSKDDDGGPGLNARIVFRPSMTETYTVMATSLPRTRGTFLLKVFAVDVP